MSDERRYVRMEAADHPHAGEVGLVVGRKPCTLTGPNCCDNDDLIVRLPDGTLTEVYELEVADVSESESVSTTTWLSFNAA